jgi:AraC-like DNA-binding protein
MKNTAPIKINSISEFHQLRGLPKPEHPLISVVDYATLGALADNITILTGYYVVSVKRGVGKMQYGQQPYDFNEGIMYFLAPNQLLKLEHRPEEDRTRTGWMLLMHPDFFWGTVLAGKIKQYEFFDYSVNEALFLSDKEENIIQGIIDNIKREYHSAIDKFSQDIIVAQIDALLNYAQRFYERQFITRKISNHRVLESLEKLLNDYFEDKGLLSHGLPTVQYISQQLLISPSYLSGLLKSLTGKSTQQHIQDKIIEKAKERLSTTSLTVSEIAYELGFEHSQSFSKLFKSKTNQTPLAFRSSFN